MNYLYQMVYQARREAAALGCVAGCVIGAAVMLAIHIGLTHYSNKKHEQVQVAIRESHRRELTECQELVTDLAEAPYDDVVELKRNIIKTQGGAK